MQMFIRKHTFLILFLAAASMLVLLFHLPWKNTYLYNERSHFRENQGVNFKNRTISKGIIKVGTVKANVGSLDSIVNAPQNGRIDGSRNVELNKTDTYSKIKSGNKIPSTNHTGLNLMSNKIINYNEIIPYITILKFFDSKNKVSSVRLSTTTITFGSAYQNTDLTKGLLSSNFNSNLSGDADNSDENRSTSTFFSNPNALESASSPQKASAENPPVGPGETEEPPVGPGETDIPVPDGWGFLLALAVIYIGIKRKMFLQ